MAYAFNDDKSKYDVTNVIQFKRRLTSTDNLDNITENGFYYYVTGNVPANAPYSNASIVEVLGSNSNTTQKIQRVTRYGLAGHTSLRALSDGTWLDWSELAKATDITALQNGKTNKRNISWGGDFTIDIKEINFGTILSQAKSDSKSISIVKSGYTPISMTITSCLGGVMPLEWDFDDSVANVRVCNPFNQTSDSSRVQIYIVYIKNNLLNR